MTVRQSIAIVLICLGAVLAGACSEHLNGGAACPVLCPGQKLTVIDTTFRIDHSSPVYDTTIASFPLLGDEGTLEIAEIPNRADVRGILRFDSLTSEWTPTGDTIAQGVKHAHDPRLWFIIDTHNVSASRGSDQVQFAAFEVDTTADTTVSVLASLFNGDHILGLSKVFFASQLADTGNATSADTVEIVLDTVAFLQKVLGDRKLRIGILPIIRNFKGDGFRATINETTAPYVRYYASTDSLKDTLYGRLVSNLRSSTPLADSSLLTRLVHYPLIVQGAIPDSADALNIGGIPARRVFMRFALPSRIVDTANVIRATLMLSPRTQPIQLPGDTAAVYPWPVVSSNKVMTPAEAANFIVSNTVYSLDSTQVEPYVGTKVAIDFVNAVRNWQNVSDTINTRALVLRILNEGGTTLESSFWSSNAPGTALRPHIRLQYVKRSSFGVP